jgi:hypothetical protein
MDHFMKRIQLEKKQTNQGAAAIFGLQGSLKE